MQLGQLRSWEDHVTDTALVQDLEFSGSLCLALSSTNPITQVIFISGLYFILSQTSKMGKAAQAIIPLSVYFGLSR